MRTIGMIMAGGLGKRMKSTKPKVLHEVGGKPMVVRALDALGAMDKKGCGSLPHGRHGPKRTQRRY